MTEIYSKNLDRDRALVQSVLAGETFAAVAKRYQLSTGRVRQLTWRWCCLANPTLFHALRDQGIGAFREHRVLFLLQFP